MAATKGAGPVTVINRRREHICSLFHGRHMGQPYADFSRILLTACKTRRDSADAVVIKGHGPQMKITRVSRSLGLSVGRPSSFFICPGLGFLPFFPLDNNRSPTDAPTAETVRREIMAHRERTIAPRYYRVSFRRTCPRLRLTRATSATAS